MINWEAGLHQIDELLDDIYRSGSTMSDVEKIVAAALGDTVLYEDTTISYHDDGTDYLNVDLVSKVHAAIERYVGPLDVSNLAAIAAVNAVKDHLIIVWPEAP